MSMDEQTRENTIKNFDFAYTIVKEKKPFTKMKSICELYLVLYFDSMSSDRDQVHIQNRFFCVRHLSSGTGQGLFDCFKKVMKYMKVEA